MIPQKLEIIRRLECGKATERLWLHTTMDQQLSMIQRNRRSSESVKVLFKWQTLEKPN